MGVVCLHGPSPWLIPPLPLGKKTLINWNTVSTNKRAAGRVGGASHKNKLETTINIKSQLTRAGRATTNKQTNKHLQGASSRAGHWTGFGFGKWFQEDKNHRREEFNRPTRRNKKSWLTGSSRSSSSVLFVSAEATGACWVHTVIYRNYESRVCRTRRRVTSTLTLTANS